MTTVDRLRDGYYAQQGACNPSGLLHSLERHIQDCQNERVAAAEDIGISLIVHQLRFLVYFKDSPEQFAERCVNTRALIRGVFPNPMLLSVVQKALARCALIRENEGDTSTICHDQDLCALVLILYVGTQAKDYDDSFTAWNQAYLAAKMGVDGGER